jgi:NAD(P)H-flavin reductase
VSSRLVAYLAPGSPVVLMGPTGAPLDVPADTDVLLVGGGTGHPALLPFASALRAHGCRVLYVAASADEPGTREAIEAAADQVLWTSEAGEGLAPSRPQDRFVPGSVVDALVALAEGRLGEPRVPLAGVTHVVAAGPTPLLSAAHAARRGVLASHLRADHHALASLNTPMQCMMKEICAQCLQKQVDPRSGRETVVYACARPAQPLDGLNFESLRDRHRQNSVQEKLSNAWLDHLLETVDLPHV